MEEGINRVSLALSLPAGGAMEKDIAELMGQEQPLVFATVDLDLFDSVNKRFGREEGGPGHH